MSFCQIVVELLMWKSFGVTQLAYCNFSSISVNADFQNMNLQHQIMHLFLSACHKKVPLSCVINPFRWNECTKRDITFMTMMWFIGDEFCHCKFFCCNWTHDHVSPTHDKIQQKQQIENVENQEGEEEAKKQISFYGVPLITSDKSRMIKMMTIKLKDDASIKGALKPYS